MLHQSARMVITTMRRTPALLTDSTARVGSLVEYSSGLDPGTTAMADIGDVAVITAAEVTTDAVGTMAAVATTNGEDTEADTAGETLTMVMAVEIAPGTGAKTLAEVIAVQIAVVM